MNKKKIINDPVYGFITIPYEIIYDLLEHPYFQRLRNIKQLGLTHLVYPGALHTRFHHALGAMHLMGMALETLKNKGIEISEEEAKAVTIAILLHDIGHGPFSHALEKWIVSGISHEDISSLLMSKLNTEFNGQLSMAIEIFNNRYHKKFLHQLVSGQLDMDRMDYLNRDSFYTGVSEGVIGFDRILKMITVHNDKLVVEAKGIYSIEKFLIARRLMYWQVYFHKTVVSAEQMLIKILQRAKELALEGQELFATPAFKLFLYHKVTKEDFKKDPSWLNNFSLLDDADIYSAIKVWRNHSDRVLSLLCDHVLNRNLYRIEIQDEEFSTQKISELNELTLRKLGIEKQFLHYFVFTDTIGNNMYDMNSEGIDILQKNGLTADISASSDTLSLISMSKTVKKNYLCYLKEVLD